MRREICMENEATHCCCAWRRTCGDERGWRAIKSERDREERSRVLEKMLKLCEPPCRLCNRQLHNHERHSRTLPTLTSLFSKEKPKIFTHCTPPPSLHLPSLSLQLVDCCCCSRENFFRSLPRAAWARRGLSVSGFEFKENFSFSLRTSTARKIVGKTFAFNHPKPTRARPAFLLRWCAFGCSVQQELFAPLTFNAN